MNLGLSCAETGVGLDDPCGSFPTQDILSFCDSMTFNLIQESCFCVHSWVVAAQYLLQYIPFSVFDIWWLYSLLRYQKGFSLFSAASDVIDIFRMQNWCLKFYISSLSTVKSASFNAA